MSYLNDEVVWDGSSNWNYVCAVHPFVKNETTGETNQPKTYEKGYYHYEPYSTIVMPTDYSIVFRFLHYDPTEISPFPDLTYQLYKFDGGIRDVIWQQSFTSDELSENTQTTSMSHTTQKLITLTPGILLTPGIEYIIAAFTEEELTESPDYPSPLAFGSMYLYAIDTGTDSVTQLGADPNYPGGEEEDTQVVLSAVAQPGWSKKVATWQDVPNASNYKVILYNANGEPLDTQTVPAGTQRYDYTDLIENYLPAGSYQCSVQALP